LFIIDKLVYSIKKYKEMAFLKNEKIGKALARRLESSVSEMADSRIITKNLVYVIGLSSSIASRETLQKKEYFGQYGNITKIVVNSNKAYNLNNPNGPSFSAYVTYSKPYEASLAILSLDNILVDDHLIRASFGTTK
jgi:CCR4-NOT transcription complex subunit 4